MPAVRTGDLYLAFAFRNPQFLMAFRTIEIAMSLLAFLSCFFSFSLLFAFPCFFRIAFEETEEGKELLVLHSPFSYIAAEHPPQSNRHQYDCYYGDNRPCSLLYYDGSRDRENQSHSDKKYRQLIRAIAP